MSCIIIVHEIFKMCSLIEQTCDEEILWADLGVCV